jgi:broad specificity phosphatase PhoE
LVRRIALVRHGRSAHVHAGWIDARGFRAWREAYEAAGIADGEQPPGELTNSVEDTDLVVSSDAPRAIASARLLARGREVLVSPLLRELELLGPDFGGVRLPLLAWACAVGGRTLVSTLRGQYPSAGDAERVEGAAQWLENLATAHAQVFAVTHASFRRRLSQRLMESGWQPEGNHRSLRPWSVRFLNAPVSPGLSPARSG